MLQRAAIEAENERRGKLKIFFGMAPGVGKTFALLQSAQEKRKAGATGLTYTIDFAHALYVAALAEPGGSRRGALLVEATALLHGLPAETQQFADIQQLLAWIEAARNPVAA